MDPTAATNPSEPTPPLHWSEAVLALLASRSALIEFEAKEAVNQSLRRFVMAAAIGFCGGVAWLLLLAALLPLVADATGSPWPLVALVLALLHLLGALVLAYLIRHPGGPAFPVTRAEFHKDQQWLRTLLANRKSNG